MPNPRRKPLSSFHLFSSLAYVPAAPAARSAPPGACVPRLLVRLARCCWFVVVGVGFIDLRDRRSRKRLLRRSRKRLLRRSRHGDQGHRRRAPRRGEMELNRTRERDNVTLKRTSPREGGSKETEERKNHLAKLSREREKHRKLTRRPEREGARAALPLPFFLFLFSLPPPRLSPTFPHKKKKQNPITLPPNSPPTPLSTNKKKRSHIALALLYAPLRSKKKKTGPQRVRLQARRRDQRAPRGQVAQAPDRRGRARRGLHERGHDPLRSADQVADRRQVRRRDRAADRGKGERVFFFCFT